MDGQTGRYMTLCKGIWDHINQEELKQIKQYLRMMGEPKFGKAQLENVENGVDLLPILQERELLGINNLSFIKTLLKYLKRDDLLKEVNNYEKESVKAADAKHRRPKSDPTCAPSDSTCESRYFQQSIDVKKLEIEQKVQHRTHLSTQLKNLKEENEKETDIIADSEKELTKIELKKEQKQENARKCKDEREKIEAKIRKLQKESSEKWDLERSLYDDVDRMSQTGRDVQNRISLSKSKKDENSKQCMSISAKEKECSQTINNLHLELNKLELQINQPRQRPHSNENVSDLNSGAFSDVTTDAIPTERANTINKESWIGEDEITSEKKNTYLKDIHILHFSQAIKTSSLLQVATVLEIPENEVDIIKCNNPHSADSWANELLLKWRNKKGREATAGNLLEKLFDAWDLCPGYIDPKFVRKALKKL